MQAHLTRTTDRELLYLSAYLSKIAQLDSLEALNHRRVTAWEGCMGWKLMRHHIGARTGGSEGLAYTEPGSRRQAHACRGAHTVFTPR